MWIPSECSCTDTLDNILTRLACQQAIETIQGSKCNMVRAQRHSRPPFPTVGLNTPPRWRPQNKMQPPFKRAYITPDGTQTWHLLNLFSRKQVPSMATYSLVLVHSVTRLDANHPFVSCRPSSQSTGSTTRPPQPLPVDLERGCAGGSRWVGRWPPCTTLLPRGYDCTHKQIPDTPCMPSMPTLEWFEGCLGIIYHVVPRGQ